MKILSEKSDYSVAVAYVHHHGCCFFFCWLLAAVNPKPLTEDIPPIFDGSGEFF